MDRLWTREPAARLLEVMCWKRHLWLVPALVPAIFPTPGNPSAAVEAEHQMKNSISLLPSFVDATPQTDSQTD